MPSLPGLGRPNVHNSSTQQPKVGLFSKPSLSIRDRFQVAVVPTPGVLWLGVRELIVRVNR